MDRTMKRQMATLVASVAVLAATNAPAAIGGSIDAQAQAHLHGGDLKLEWQGDGNPVMMTGETVMAFQGEITNE